MSDSEPVEPSSAEAAELLQRVEDGLLGGPRRYTRGQVADRTGLDPDDTSRLWRALGFASVGDDDIVFTDGDVAALELAKRLSESAMIDDEQLTAMTRMLGQAFSRLATWQGQLLVDIVSHQSDAPPAVGDVALELLPIVGQLQDFVWRRQLVAYLSRLVPGSSSDVMAPGVSAVVGFVDMSGFTALTRRATEPELRDLLEAFEAVATDAVGTHNGRIVKTIGDEVLFVADTPGQGAAIALDLLAAAAEDPRLPGLRAGLAAGPVVTRLGDVYGSTVNIASRLTSLARSGWVLVDRVMAESLRSDDRYELRSRRPESVRGFHHLRQWRLLRDTATPTARSESRRAGSPRKGRR
jgi:adenylate cyclase